MKITLNLSVSRTPHERYGLAWAVPVLLVAMAGLIWCVKAAFDSLSEYHKYRHATVELLEKENLLRAREITLRKDFERPEHSALLGEAHFVNTLIDKKQFSVTELTSKITKLLPASVRLDGMTLAQPGSEPVIRFSIVGNSEEAIETFLIHLEDSPDFKDVTIINQGFERAGAGASPVAISCTARYRGGAAR